MPSHFAAGWGAFHRSAPTGGAAYGTPRKMRTSPLAPVVPEIDPLSRRTGSGTAAGRATPNARTHPARATSEGRFMAFLSGKNQIAPSRATDAGGVKPATKA